MIHNKKMFLFIF